MVADLPGSVTPAKWHLVLCEPDIEYERELRLMQTHGSGLFEVGVRGAGRIRDFEEWPGYSSS